MSKNYILEKEAVHYMEFIYGTYGLNMFLDAIDYVFKKRGIVKKVPTVKKKMKKVMHEFKEGELHSGSKKGPEVKSRAQAIAIGLSEARKEGAKVPKKGKK